MLTKIALAAALVIGPVSATLASDNGGKVSHARASYAQAHVQRSSNADSNASTETSRPQTAFEKSWFDYQDQE
jgi:hypothetical protein